MEALTRLWNKKVASFVTCRGRRRIGKSRLSEEFAARSECRFIEIAGLAPRPRMTDADQIANFAAQLAAQSDLPGSMRPSSWDDAFAYLNVAIRDGGRTVVLRVCAGMAWPLACRSPSSARRAAARMLPASGPTCAVWTSTRICWSASSLTRRRHEPLRKTDGRMPTWRRKAAERWLAL